MPLLDGTERLGVLDVMVDDVADLYDPGLREQCRWLSGLLGHLVTITTGYGDALDILRRRRRRTPAAELIWSLLPPLTAGTETFLLAGMLEPCFELAATPSTTPSPRPPSAWRSSTRCVDFLEREAASGHPPAETVRRLIQAVMNHQNGVLQDDATVLLARWDASGRTP